MIRLSARHALPLTLLAALAAVPVYTHASGRLEREVCAAPEVLGHAVVHLHGGRPADSDPGRRAEGILQLRRGLLPFGPRGSEPLRVALGRSFDTIGLASGAHGYVTARFEVSEKRTETWEREGESLPVHWLVDRTRARPQFAAYVFLQEHRPVAGPIAAALRDAPLRLIRGAPPTTLLAVGGMVPASRLGEARAAAERWLFGAWREYRLACGVL